MFAPRQSLTLLILLCLSGAAGAASPWAFGGNLDLGYDSNSGNAQGGTEAIDSGVANLNLSLGGQLPLTDRLALLLRGSLQHQQYERIEGLTNGKATALLRLLLRPGRDVQSPTFSLSASTAIWRFDSQQRDSEESRASLIWQQPLSTRFGTRLSVNGSRRRAPDSAVFDLDNRSLALDLEYQLTPALRLNTGYLYQRGDTVATSLPGPLILSAAEAVEPDDAFGNGRRAYRLEAATGVSSLGLGYALSQRWSLDFQAQHVSARSERADIDYERWLLTGGLLWRFGL